MGKYSRLLKAKGFEIVKSSFPLYEKPDPSKSNGWILSDEDKKAIQEPKRYEWIAVAEKEWLRCQEIYERNKKVLERANLVCPFCEEKARERGIEIKFCLHADFFRRKNNG